MPLLMYVIAPGFSSDPEKFALSVSLTRIAFPYLLFMSLTALQSGVLNSLRRFTAAAAAPILLNLIMIVTQLMPSSWAGAIRRRPAMRWSGHVASGIAQFLLLMIACRRAGFALGIGWPKLTPDAKALIWLSVPGIIAGGITQVNLLLATIIASSLDRAVSYLYYADRVYQLPWAWSASRSASCCCPTWREKAARRR